MAKYCGNCGIPLSQGCTCQPIVNIKNPSGFSPNNLSVFFLFLWNTVLAFPKNPIGVAYESAISKNWPAASVIIVIAAIFQATSIMIMHYRRRSTPDFPSFMTAFIIELILLGGVAAAIFGFSKLVNKSNNDFVISYTATGIAMTSFAAASILVSFLSFFFTELNAAILGFARVFTLFTVVMAIKVIDQIKKENILVYIASLTAAAYYLSNLVLTRIFK